MEKADESQAALLRQAIEQGDRDAFMNVFEIVKTTDAINYTSRRAVEEADKAVAALDVLPESIYKQALADLARFSVDRNY
jgi:octaprenyl-diphosphate synthase